MLDRLRQRKERQFFGVLPRADATLTYLWWLVLLLRGVLPAVFAIAMGVLVSAVQGSSSLKISLARVGVLFIVLQILPPIHTAVGANLGDRMAAWLYDRLTEACVRPPGMGHLEAAAAKNSEGRITILVSHRFSSVRMADLILVLDGAKVVECGTHEALIVRRSPYSELYGIQAAAYR